MRRTICSSDSGSNHAAPVLQSFRDCAPRVEVLLTCLLRRLCVCEKDEVSSLRSDKEVSSRMPSATSRIETAVAAASFAQAATTSFVSIDS
jgi:hypothetical protein